MDLTHQRCAEVHHGLEGIVAATTELSCVDGEAGQLTVRGYAIEDLAPRARFEDVVYLLWNGRLPSPTESRAFASALAQRRALPDETLGLLRAAAARALDPMDALTMSVSSLALCSEVDEYTLVAAMPTMVGSYARLVAELEPVAPNPQLSHSESFLHQMTGEVPDRAHVRALDTYLNTVADHGLNASTFAARVIVSTGSDRVAAAAGALGALKGRLHGGAPGPALDMVLEIARPEAADAWIQGAIERGERLMGFGHRVYRVRDPRADVLAAEAERLYQGGADTELYALALAVEKTALRLLRAAKPERRIETNVEYYTALLLHGIGIPAALFTPTFACARMAGWMAHSREQEQRGRLIRPKSRYVGEFGRVYPGS